jgi:GH25 family lysozyme M1 (1,4-beta-N-acetylmuramidase)
MMDDDGQAISYQVVRRGTPVRSADGVKLGTVRRVQEAKREHIFDGIVIDTSKGKRFVDAPEVARIAERAVTLTFSAAEAEEHLADVSSRLAERFRNTKTARRAKRLGRRARDSWDRR